MMQSAHVNFPLYEIPYLSRPSSEAVAKLAVLCLTAGDTRAEVLKSERAIVSVNGFLLIVCTKGAGAASSESRW